MKSLTKQKVNKGTFSVYRFVHTSVTLTSSSTRTRLVVGDLFVGVSHLMMSQKEIINVNANYEVEVGD